MKLDNWKHSNITLDLVYHDDDTITATLADTIDGERYKLIEDLSTQDLFNFEVLCYDTREHIYAERARLEAEIDPPILGLSVEDRNK